MYLEAMDQSLAVNLSNQDEKKRMISTFIFLDLESTGLGGNGKQPRITELSLVAVHRDNLQDPCADDTPRVLNKLTLCTYPMKVVEHGAAQITGLYNDNLFYQKDFDNDTSSMINLFVQRQAAPTCIVAHNGHQFDFPLLKAELRRLGCNLPDGLLCADTLEAFRTLDEQEGSDRDELTKHAIHNPRNGGNLRSMSDVTFTPIRPESNTNGMTLVRNGIPVPRFYNDQQESNNVTPELQVILESWKKEPPPAPCAKRCATRVNKVPPYEAPESEVSTVRKKLFEEKVNESEIGTPPPVKGSETPTSLAVRSRMESGLSFKAKKNLFGDSGENDTWIKPTDAINESSVKNGHLEEPTICAKNEYFFSESQTPTQELEEETQLYWGGDSIENPSNLLKVEHLEKQDSKWLSNTSDEDEISDDLLLAAVIEAEEDDTQKYLLDIEMSQEQDSGGHKRPAGSEDDYSPAATPSTSGTSKLTNPHKKRKLSYKLNDLHKRIVGYDMQNQHRAEDDCLALIRIFHRDFRRVCPWVDEHAVSFADISPMYTSKLKSKPCLDQNEFPYQVL